MQHCIKAQQSQAYAQKVKLSNLKMMAQTVAYVQEHGFQSKADLDAALSDASAQSTDARNLSNRLTSPLQAQKMPDDMVVP